MTYVKQIRTGTATPGDPLLFETVPGLPHSPRLPRLRQITATTSQQHFGDPDSSSGVALGKTGGGRVILLGTGQNTDTERLPLYRGGHRGNCGNGHQGGGWRRTSWGMMTRMGRAGIGRQAGSFDDATGRQNGLGMPKRKGDILGLVRWLHAVWRERWCKDGWLCIFCVCCSRSAFFR
jgi:hypothetical protein